MSEPRDPIAAARSAVGARFRLHGREPAGGLDCVGLAAWAHGILVVPSGYGLRRGDAEGVMLLIAAAGFRRVATAEPGDLILASAGPGQLHLGIWTGAGTIHADAVLRRVVERPGALPWPVIGYWRRESGFRSMWITRRPGPDLGSRFFTPVGSRQRDPGSSPG